MCLTALCAGPVFGWTAAGPVAATSQDSLDPRAAVDSGGKVHSAWRERVGGSVFQIWYSTNLGGSFSSPLQISQGGSVNCYWPAIASDGSDVHAVWSSDQTGSNFEAWYRKRSGGSWGATLNASNTLIKSLRPQVAARGGLGPVVSWDEAIYADDNYDVYLSEWTGSGFGPAMNISNTAGGPVYGSVNSNIAISPSGDVTVVWMDSITGSYHPNARRRVGGVWQARQQISTKQGGPATPGIAAGPDNQVHVVYSAEGTIWYQKWNGSSWTGSDALPGLSGALRPKIAVDDQGLAHVVTDNSSYGSGEVYYSTNSSGSWSLWANISNTPGTNSLNAGISFGGGILAVIWQDNSDGAGGTGVFDTWYSRHALAPVGPTGTVAGRVRDQFGSPISNATVASGPYETTSSANGAYSLALPTGTHTISAAKLHYASHIVTGVEVVQNAVTTLDLTITAVRPGPVASLGAVPSDSAVHLRWTNPASLNFAGTRIVCRTDRFPTGPTDGAPVCDRAALPGSTDSFTHTGLANGIACYYAAFAHDGEGHYSTGVTASAVPHPLSCFEAKLLAEGSPVGLKGKIVTGVFPADASIFIGDPDRTGGIRVAASQTGLIVGDHVDVSGTVTTRKPDGVTPSERQITPTSLARTTPASNTPLAPLGLTCRTVGGAAIGLAPGVTEPTGLPDPQWRPGIGANNMGMLVKIAGKVTLRIGSYIYIDDGSGVRDISGRIGVMIKCPDTNIPVLAGSMVSVTGIVEGSIPTGWPTNRRMIRIRDYGDIRAW